MTPYYPESNVRMVKNICNLIYVLRSRLLRVVPCVFYVKSDIDPLLGNCFRMGEVTSVEQLPLPKRTAKTSTSESKQKNYQGSISSVMT